MRVFCDNPKCPNHVAVDESIYEYGRLFSVHVNPANDALAPTKRHVYAKPFAGHISFCDICKKKKKKKAIDLSRR